MKWYNLIFNLIYIIYFEIVWTYAIHLVHVFKKSCISLYKLCWYSVLKLTYSNIFVKKKILPKQYLLIINFHEYSVYHSVLLVTIGIRNLVFKCATTLLYLQAALVMFELAWVMSKDTKDMLWWGSYFILPLISHSRKKTETIWCRICFETVFT